MKKNVLSENVDFFGMPIFESEDHAGHMDSGTAMLKPKVEEPFKTDEKDLEKAKVKPKEIGKGEVKLVPMKGEGSSDDQLDDLAKAKVKPSDDPEAKPKEMSESDMEKLILMGPEAALGEKPEKEDQSSGKEHSEKEAPAAVVKAADAGKEPEHVDGSGVKADADDEKEVAKAAVKPAKVGSDPKLMAERARLRKKMPPKMEAKRPMAKLPVMPAKKMESKDRKAIGESTAHPVLQRRMMEEARQRVKSILAEAKSKKKV